VQPDSGVDANHKTRCDCHLQGTSTALRETDRRDHLPLCINYKVLLLPSGKAQSQSWMLGARLQLTLPLGSAPTRSKLMILSIAILEPACFAVHSNYHS
jgi:hypothetical protein